jgi:hypothetical protein
MMLRWLALVVILVMWGQMAGVGSAAAAVVVVDSASGAGALGRSAVGPDAAADAGSDFAIKKI